MAKKKLNIKDINNNSLKLVLVAWEDSQGVLSGWQRLEDFTAEVPTVYSIGWVVRENEKMISVCGNIGEETESTAYQGNGIMTIPKTCILSVKELKV